MRALLRPLLPLALLAVFVAPAAAGGADTTTVECGIFRDYTAPDPGTATPGSITFGLSGSPEAIAADATLVPPADSSLASLQGGAPTALTVIRNSGVITSLAFADSCTISGTPILVPDLFGSGQDGYVLADRLFVPVEQVGANPGLAALFGTAADSDGVLSITFEIDLSTGVPFEFSATTSFAGEVVMLPGGDVQVGDATLPDSVIAADARADLQAAADLGVDATVVVDGAGSIDPSSKGEVIVAITLTVTYAAPPTPSPSADLLPDTATNR